MTFVNCTEHVWHAINCLVWRIRSRQNKVIRRRGTGDIVVVGDQSVGSPILLEYYTLSKHNQYSERGIPKNHENMSQAITSMMYGTVLKVLAILTPMMLTCHKSCSFLQTVSLLYQQTTPG